MAGPRIQIQKFGGAGVGHWTLDVLMNGVWVTFCLEQVVKGKIALSVPQASKAARLGAWSSITFLKNNPTRER